MSPEPYHDHYDWLSQDPDVSEIQRAMELAANRSQDWAGQAVHIRVAREMFRFFTLNPERLLPSRRYDNEWGMDALHFDGGFLRPQGSAARSETRAGEYVAARKRLKNRWPKVERLLKEQAPVLDEAFAQNGISFRLAPRVKASPGGRGNQVRFGFALVIADPEQDDPEDPDESWPGQPAGELTRVLANVAPTAPTTLDQGRESVTRLTPISRAIGGTSESPGPGREIEASGDHLDIHYALASSQSLNFASWVAPKAPTADGWWYRFWAWAMGTGLFLAHISLLAILAHIALSAQDVGLALIGLALVGAFFFWIYRWNGRLVTERGCFPKLWEVLFLYWPPDDDRIVEISTDPRRLDRSKGYFRRYVADCPICGDAGAKCVSPAPGNIDYPGRIVGRCRRNPREHVFSFDHVTKLGRRI